jgi:tetratricopeptide (TPR) repeat protein
MFATQLAYHWREVGDHEKERGYAFIAGKRAADQYANATAIDFFSRAISLVDTDNYETRWSYLTERERVFNRIGSRDAQAQDLQVLDELVNNLNDPRRSAELAILQAEYKNDIGEFGDGVKACERAIEIAQAHGFSDILAEANRLWGFALIWMGDHAKSEEVLTAGREHFQEVRDQLGENKLLNTMGILFGVQGNMEKAEEYFIQSLEGNRKANHLRGQSDALNNLGILASMRSDIDLAEQRYAKSLSILREIGYRRGQTHTLNNLGLSSMSAGDFTRAWTYFEESKQIAYEIDDFHSQGITQKNLGVLSYYRGENDQALMLFTESLARYRQTGDSKNTLVALRHLGRICLAQGRLDDAKKFHSEALENATGQELSGFFAEIYAQLANIAFLGGVSFSEPLTEAMLRYEEDPNLPGAEFSFNAYLNLCEVLFAENDSRALRVLAHAHGRLLKEASKITNEALRKKYLNSVPEHRELIEFAKIYLGI